MGRNCCVPNCRGNYKATKIFRLPSENRYPDERSRWLKAIPRDDIPNHKNTSICEEHWPSGYETITRHGQLRPRHAPSVFKGFKSSLIPTPPTPARTTKRSLSEIRCIIPDEMSLFNERDKILSFNDIYNNISSESCSVEFVKYQNNGSIMIQSTNFLEGTCVPMFSLKIKEDFSFEAYHCGARCTIKTLSQNRIHVIKRWSHIEEALRFLNVSEITAKKEVIRQSIVSMGALTCIGEKKYPTETLVRAFEYFSISRSAYSRMRNDYELPSIDTLTRLTSKVRNLGDDSFLKNVYLNMEERQKSCFLLIDEVYVKPMLQYHGGRMYGKAINDTGSLAKTVLGFMVVSLFGGPKFLYRMLHVQGLTTDFLFEQTNCIISKIRHNGGNPVAIICDGNRVNQSFFKKFDTINPWRTRDNIFLLFDFVHLLKNIRNNWITETSKEIEFCVDGETKIAKWSDLETLHEKEKGKLVKLSKLTEVSVFPQPIERQKVSTCLKVFCDETYAALKVQPQISEQISNCDGTATFISKFLEFWKIVNVKGPYEDTRFNDSDRKVICSADDKSLQTLLEMAEFAEHISVKQGKRAKQLTKDTGKCLAHTCRGLVYLSKHLLDTGHEYVLLGKATTDPLEKEFSKLRQGSGGTYFVTVQQILEKVAIHKTKLLLKLDCDMNFNVESGHSCDKCSYLANEKVCDVLDNLHQMENSIPPDTKNALVYIAGYITRKDECEDDTNYYYQRYGSFTDEINRGGLKLPGDSICQWTFFSYVIFHMVAGETCRKSLSNLLMLISELHNFNLTRRHASIMSNILFNNHCHLYSPRSEKEPKQKILKLME
jgi:hypothetical protein